MNDCTGIVVKAVREALSASVPGARLTTRYSRRPTDLPVLLLELQFPSATPSTADSSGRELWTRVVVRAMSYSGTSLQEAKSMIVAADEALGGLGFARSSLATVPNADESVQTVAATWRASFGASTFAAW